MSWLSRLFGRRALERDLDRELRFHLDAETADGIRAGLPPEDARRRARMALGGPEQLKEELRDTRGTRWLEDWLQDARLALRGMTRAPGFTAAAVLTLAVGLGANTAVWSVLDALLLRAIPVERPEQLHTLRGTGSDADPFTRLSFPALQRLQAAAGPTARLAAMAPVSQSYLALGDEPEPVQLQFVSADWFSVLGVGAARGRPLGPGDNRDLGGHPVAVLSDGYWTRRFGRDPDVVGRTLRVSGTALTVVGIMQPGFTGLTVGQPVDLWVPVVMQHELGHRSNATSDNADTEQPWLPQDGIAWLTLVTRIAPSERALVEARLDRQFRTDLADRYAASDSAERAYQLRAHVRLDAVPRGFSSLRERFADPLVVLMVSVGLVLLIACGNLASLLLSRSLARTHEMAVRVSLGARPGRLVRQALTESQLLALLGGALGLLVAHWGTRGLLRLATANPQGVPLDVGLDLRVLAFALGASVLTGLLFGLAPAVRASRTDLHDAFKTGGRVVGDRSGRRWPLGRVLVVGQLALSLLLATGAGLFVRTLRNVLAVDAGVERERLLIARIETAATRYPPDRLAALYRQLLDAVGAVPGVRSASLSMNGIATGSRRYSAFIVPGQARPPEWDNSGQENYVSPDYFSTVGMDLIRGRAFTAADGPAPRIAVVGESLARHFFDTVDVVGRRIGYGDDEQFEIVGVVRDARVNSLQERPPRLIYYPLSQGPTEYAASLEVRVSGSPTAVIPAVRAAIRSVDRSIPVREVVTVDDLLGRGAQSQRLVARLAGLFSILALLLAGIGLYGVIAYSVSRRTSELGVRLAMGARPRAVQWLVLRECLGMVVAGLGLGLTLWLPAAALVRNLVFGLSPRDPTALVAAGVLLLGVGIAAGLLPAWRASRVDPVTALRSE